MSLYYQPVIVLALLCKPRPNIHKLLPLGFYFKVTWVMYYIQVKLSKHPLSLSFPPLHALFLLQGDFRLTVDDVKRCGPLHVDGKVIDIKTIYLDTTFCHPKSMNIITRVSQNYHLDNYISPSLLLFLLLPSRMKLEILYWRK